MNKNIINNLSDIESITNNDKFNELLNKANSNEKISIKNNLIHDHDLSKKEQLFFNLDNYISFIKSKLFINQFELRYIIELTIYNRYNKILLDSTYYFDNPNYYHKVFIKMFMFKYNKNYKLLSKYINIRKRNFDELINLLNNNKKRSYIYFEDIKLNNMNFYIPLIQKMEETNS